ncbi:MAG: transcriptional regulator, partial [Butyricimonas virosa]|nr:transcriptional regulator [Butyricimonas virosa]
YAALINYLAEKEYIRMLPFDAAFCQGATVEDIDLEKVDQFIGVALAQRGFPLERGTDMETVLTHLNLLQNGRVSNAAVLLFGKQPQRFVMGAEVKCAHFYGMEVTKPIPA